MGFIDRVQLAQLANEMGSNGYSDYLTRLANAEIV
jgi:hypothetical protein